MSPVVVWEPAPPLLPPTTPGQRLQVVPQLGRVVPQLRRLPLPPLQPRLQPRHVRRLLRQRLPLLPRRRQLLPQLRWGRRSDPTCRDARTEKRPDELGAGMGKA